MTLIQDRQRAGPGEGVDSSFEAFYRAQVDRVYRALTLSLGDPDLAREATDEGMARACARWETVSALDNPGGWVFRVGFNWACSWWRKLRREQPMPDRMPGVVAQPDPIAVHALQVLGRLPRTQRAVVVCRILLGLSTAETATALGVAEGTVKSRLARGLTALRGAVSKGELT
jgi:DNA-directed RNA polymerase specialized sigma24 family protein